MSADGQQFIFSTYFGGNRDDGATRVDVDPAGHVWIVGSTDSMDLPMRNPLQGTHGDDGCCQDAFVAELSADARQLLFSTFLKGTDIDSGTGLGVDGLGSVYVGGQTASPNFPPSSRSSLGLRGRATPSWRASWSTVLQRRMRDRISRSTRTGPVARA